MELQTIIAGGGAQSVEVYAFDALDRIAKPTSATARIVDLDFSEDAADADRILLATSAASIDSISTTTSAAAGPLTADPRKIVIVAGVPTVGRFYVISGGGTTESFKVGRVDSLNIYARDPLRTAFATGATVTGALVTATFPSARANLATELDRRTLYGVDWTFTGTTGRASVRTFCRIERRHRGPRATVNDLTTLDPRLAFAAHDSTKLEAHLQWADREVSALLSHRGTILADSDEGMVGTMATAWRAIELTYRTMGVERLTDAEWAAGEFGDWKKRLLSGHKPDDAVETRRDTDARRVTRSAAAFGLVT